MYLPPSQTEEQRKAIKNKFTEYLEVIQPLLEEYNAHVHWAKIELPQAPAPSTFSNSLAFTTSPSTSSDHGDSDLYKHYLHMNVLIHTSLYKNLL